MARAEIPVKVIKDLVDYRDDKKLLQWIINRIEKRAKKK